MKRKCGRPKGPGIDWDAVLAAAVQSGANGSQIARAVGVQRSSVYFAAEKRGVRLPKGGGVTQQRLDDEFRAAVIAKMSPARFCITHGISSGSLHNLEKRHGMRLPRKSAKHRNNIVVFAERAA